MALIAAVFALSSDVRAGGNNPPVVYTGGNFGVDYRVDCNNHYISGSAVTSVQLDGSLSYDPDGTPVTFFWHNECKEGTFDDPTSPTPVYHVGMADTCERECWIALRVSSDGQTSVQGFRVIVKDGTAPIITGPTDYLGIWGDSLDESVTGRAIVTDNCDSAPLVAYTDVVIAPTGPGQPELTVRRTWRTVDCIGLESSAVQMVRLLAPTGAVGARANLDFDPTRCPNLYSLRETGSIEITLLGSASFRAEKIIPGSLRLIVKEAPGVAIAPDGFLLWDLGSITATTYGECNSPDLDGRKDLKLRFDRLNLATQFELTRFSGQTVEVMVTGFMTSSKQFGTRDFVTIQ